MPIKEAMSLQQIQGQMAQIIMRPLVEGKVQKQCTDGGDMHDVAAQFIKPNKELNSLERLEIYNQQYWIRLLDSLQDDFPGLLTILGDERFERLCVAYLTEYPSRSYSLNSLGEHLPKFVLNKPNLTHPYSQLGHEIASFEWAEIVAYDAQSKPPLKSKHMRDQDPAKITLQLQPHITLLELNYALDDFVLRLNKPIDKSVESNAFTGRMKKATKISLPAKKHIFVAVHRIDNTIYYKRLNSDQYFLLEAIKADNTLAQACDDLIAMNDNASNDQSLSKKLNRYFADWMELKWFCH